MGNTPPAPETSETLYFGDGNKQVQYVQITVGFHRAVKLEWIPSAWESFSTALCNFNDIFAPESAAQKTKEDFGLSSEMPK